MKNSKQEILRIQIKGNQESSTGNPIGYHRTTQRGYWDKGAKRYFAWKQFLIENVNKKLKLTPKVDFREKYFLPPFTTIKTAKTILIVRAGFKSKIHADSDNIYKGVADALFANDKYLCGIHDFEYCENPYLDIAIIFNVELTTRLEFTTS